MRFLTCNVGESTMIGDRVLTVISTSGDIVRLGLFNFRALASDPYEPEELISSPPDISRSVIAAGGHSKG